MFRIVFTLCIGKTMPALHFLYQLSHWWFSRDVITAMLVNENKRSLISSFCLSTRNCTLQHCYLCPQRLLANHQSSPLGDGQFLGTVHTYRDIFESATFSFRIRLPSTHIRRIRWQIRNFLYTLSRIRYESGTVWTLNPEFFIR